MKKMNLKPLLLSLLIAVMTGACDDFLDLDPISQQTAGTAWDTESEINSNVLGTYYKLRESLSLDYYYYMYGDVPAEIFTTTESEGDHRMFTGSYQTLGNSDATNWTRYYKAILSANLAIEKIPETPLSVFSTSESEALKKRNSYLGEALFLRAYTYFYLVRVWGKVPLILDPVEDAADAVYDVPFETEDNILSQCLEDLDKALQCLSWDATKDAVATRANKGSVFALKMHIHMWLTRANRADIDPQNFKDAIACSDSIEASGKYQLLDITNIKSLWLQGKTVESLFEFPFNVANNEYLIKTSFPSQTLGYPLNTDRKNQGKPVYVFNTSFTGLFNPLRDQRVEQLLANFGTTNCYNLKYSSINYLNADKTDWRMDNNVVIFRLSDIYLLKAEASYMLDLLGATKEDGDYVTDALEYLNRIRLRAGLGEYNRTGAVLYRTISEERERELFLEGHRLYDWVRTGFYVSKSSNYDGNRYIQQGYLWPVNFDLLLNNVYARQTPYWQDKMEAYQ